MNLRPVSISISVSVPVSMRACHDRGIEVASTRAIRMWGVALRHAPCEDGGFYFGWDTGEFWLDRIRG